MPALTETQAMLAQMLRRLLAEHSSFEQRRERLMQPAPDRLALWSRLAEQGVLAVGAPEEAGGFGGLVADFAVVMAEIGQALAVEPVLSSAIVARLLARKGHTEAFEELVSGARVAAFAHAEGADPYAAPRTTAVLRDGVYRLNGVKPVVRHGDLADTFAVSAELDGATALFLIAGDAEGLAREPTRLIDGSSAATLTFDDAPARLLGDAADLEDATVWACVGLASEALAIVQALNTATFAYLNIRRQFGAPLASFQALQHRAAEMFIRAEELRGMLSGAVQAVDAGRAGASVLAAAVKALADEVGRLVGHEAVQLHGGMGVSDELDVSHYMRRLTAIRAEWGAAEVHRERVFASGLQDLAGESEAMAGFRAEVRAFVRDNLPKDLAAKTAAGLDLDKSDYVSWQQILHGKGWFGGAWPAAHGGAGWDLERQLVFLQEAALQGAPMIIPYGVNMVGPVLYTFGSPEQQARHLPGILSSEVWWCQGYSEPGAGSDLASLKTTAVRDGAVYVVNGSKMWTTEAHWADWMHCLVRTSSEGPAQAGISFLLIDMRTPGISIKPILTIDGQHHTNQVFFDDVKVPVENLVGREGDGWTIAKFLLSNERVAIADTGPKLRLAAKIRAMYATADEAPAAPLRASLVQDLAAVETRLATLCLLEEEYVRAWNGGASKEGPQASLLKILGTEVLQRLGEIALRLEGPFGAVHDPADLHRDAETMGSAARQASAMAHQYLYGRCWSIFGGTNEIQRNLIARAVLRP